MNLDLMWWITWWAPLRKEGTFRGTYPHVPSRYPCLLFPNGCRDVWAHPSDHLYPPLSEGCRFWWLTSLHLCLNSALKFHPRVCPSLTGFLPPLVPCLQWLNAVSHPTTAESVQVSKKYSKLFLFPDQSVCELGKLKWRQDSSENIIFLY